MSDVLVLGINGSPRHYGASTKLLNIALYYARLEGAKTDIIHLYDYNIKPCYGCVSDGLKYCRYPCIIRDDDFNELAKRVLEADAIIFSTPIYWYHVSGVLKNFIDRLTSFENMFYHEPSRSLLEGKVAAFIAVGNDSGAITAISWMMVTLNSMGAHIPAWALAYHHNREKDVLENLDAVRDAANIGRIVVKAAKLLSREEKWYELLGAEELKKAIDYASSESNKWRAEEEQRRIKRMS